MTADQWVALCAVLFSVVGGVSSVVWIARGVKSSNDHLSVSVDRLDRTIGRLTDKVDGVNNVVVSNRERIVKIETKMNLAEGEK